jgi:hypothetical protein
MTEQYTKNNINAPIGSRSVSSNTALNLDDDLVTVSTAAGPVSVTLPLANQIPGQTVTVKSNDSGSSGNAVTIQTVNSETIDGAATQSITADQGFITMQSDGSNWRITSSSSGGAVATTYRDIVYFGREWPENGSFLFFETRGYFSRGFSFEAQVIMVAPSDGQLLETVLYTTDPPGITDVSIFRPGTAPAVPYRTVTENILLPTVSTIFDFSGFPTTLVKGERFSIGMNPTAVPNIVSMAAVFEWDL